MDKFSLILFLDFSFFTFDKFCLFHSISWVTAINCTINIIKTENKSKIQSYITFTEIADTISLYLIIYPQTFSMIFNLCVLSAISDTPSPCHYEFKNPFLLTLWNKSPYVLLCVLVVWHLKYTLHANELSNLPLCRIQQVWIQSFPSSRPITIPSFTQSWRENSWIHTFPKGISAMWNANSIVQDLNSGHRIHFLRW